MSLNSDLYNIKDIKKGAMSMEYKINKIYNNSNTNNLLVIPISTFNFIKTISEDVYICPEGCGFEKITTSGYQMEPIPKLLNKILPDGLDSVLVINTPETLEQRVTLTIKKEGKDSQLECTAYEYFCSCIERFSEEEKNVSKIDVDQVCIANNDFATQKDLENIVEKIKQYAEDKKYNIRIFFDIHGGPRSNAEMMSALFSLLPLENISSEDINESPVRIDPEDIFSTNWKGNLNPDNKIYVANSGYKMLDLVSGVHEFVQYGKAESLEKYADKNNEYEELVSAMKEISNGLSMGHITTFDNGVKKLQEELDITYIQHLGKNGFLARLIEQEYDMILNDADITKQILWNNNKQFYQFAMTLCESKMMEYAQEKNVFDFSGMLVNEHLIVAKKEKEIIEAEKTLKNRLIKLEAAENEFKIKCEDNFTVQDDEAVNAKKLYIKAKKNYEKSKIELEKAKKSYKTTKFNKIDGAINRFLINFEEVTFNNWHITYLLTDDSYEMYFLCCKEGTESNLLSSFLNEHRKIKQTRNNANHAGDDNINAYTKVEDLHEGIERYIQEFNGLLDNNSQFKMYSLDCAQNYEQFCNTNNEQSIDEKTIEYIRSNILQDKIFEYFRKKIVDFNGIKDCKSENNTIYRIKKFINEYKCATINNNNIVYFKPEKDDSNLFKNGCNKFYFIMPKSDDNISNLQNFIEACKNVEVAKDNLEEWLEFENENTLESALQDALKKYIDAFDVLPKNGINFKLYSINIEDDYSKFKKSNQDCGISEKTFIKLQEEINGVKLYNHDNSEILSENGSLIELNSLVSNCADLATKSKRVTCFVNKYKVYNGKNFDVYYFKAPEEQKELFKKGNDDVKYFFIYCDDKNDSSLMESYFESIKNVKPKTLHISQKSCGFSKKYKIYYLTKNMKYDRFSKQLSYNEIDKERYIFLKKIFKENN